MVGYHTDNSVEGPENAFPMDGISAGQPTTPFRSGSESPVRLRRGRREFPRACKPRTCAICRPLRLACRQSTVPPSIPVPVLRAAFALSTQHRLKGVCCGPSLLVRLRFCFCFVLHFAAWGKSKETSHSKAQKSNTAPITGRQGPPCSFTAKRKV